MVEKDSDQHHLKSCLSLTLLSPSAYKNEGLPVKVVGQDNHGNIQ